MVVELVVGVEDIKLGEVFAGLGAVLEDVLGSRGHAALQVAPGAQLVTPAMIQHVFKQLFGRWAIDNFPRVVGLDHAVELPAGLPTFVHLGHVDGQRHRNGIEDQPARMILLKPEVLVQAAFDAVLDKDLGRLGIHSGQLQQVEVRNPLPVSPQIFLNEPAECAMHLCRPTQGYGRIGLQRLVGAV